jgi:hypothetical protein
MGWVDVAIPGVIGLLLAINPRWFTKPKVDAEATAASVRKLRRCGLLLLGVAALYMVLKFARERLS